MKTIDKLKVELQKARLVESLEAALQQSIKELAHHRTGQPPSEAPSKAADTGLLRLRELEAVLANLERENAGLRHEVRQKHRPGFFSGYSFAHLHQPMPNYCCGLEGLQIRSRSTEEHDFVDVLMPSRCRGRIRAAH